MSKRFELIKVKVIRADVTSVLEGHEGEVYYAIKDNKHFSPDTVKQTYGIVIGDVDIEDIKWSIGYANQIDIIPQGLTRTCISWEFDFELEVEEI